MPPYQQTEEQTKAALAASGLPLIKQQDILTGNILKPSPNFQPVLPEPTPLAPIPKPIAPTPTPETPKSGIDTQLAELENLSGDITGANPQAELATATANEQRALNEINLQIQQHEARALKAEEEALKMGDTLGFSRGEAAEVRREATFEALRLSALAQAKQGSLSLASQLAGNAIEAKYTQKEKELKAKRQNILNIYDSLTAEEKKRADSALLTLNENDAFVKQQRAEEIAVLNIANETASQLREGGVGASNLELQKLQNAGSIVEAQQIANELMARIPVKKTGGGAGPEVISPYGTDDYYSELFAGSKGGKALTGDQSTPLTKASIVLNQVGELATQINSTDTGPLLGILRDNNPYDVKARLIQAKLRATVPNLARGVYGEVGVLTDTDIANYIQTLPNIKTPQEANKLILSMTLRTIQNSFRSYLETYANSGRDVSGFSKQYKAIGEKIDSIENEIGINEAKTQEFEKEYQQKYGAGTDEQTQSIQEQSGFLNSIVNWFRGI